MFLQKTSLYAVRVLACMSNELKNLSDLPKDSHNTLFFSERLAKACNIPKHYLSKILAKLVHANILSAHPGKKGGYSFRKSPDELTLYEIIEPFENFNVFSNCFFGQAYCILTNARNGVSECIFHKLFKENLINFFSQLKGVTLKNFADKINRNGSIHILNKGE